MEAAIKSKQETTMNNLIMCSAVALNIFSAPAGSTVVGEIPAYQRVYLMDGSLLRDWVFIGKPGESGVSPPLPVGLPNHLRHRGRHHHRRLNPTTVRNLTPLACD
jgi:hypothetical protein